MSEPIDLNSKCPACAGNPRNQVKSHRENPDGFENTAASKQNQREVFAVKMQHSQEHEAALMKALAAIKSGYGGVMPNGNVVDRREKPDAIPIPENKFMATPKPKGTK